jgi:hypothetical protein
MKTAISFRLDNETRSDENPTNTALYSYDKLDKNARSPTFHTTVFVKPSKGNSLYNKGRVYFSSSSLQRTDARNGKYDIETLIAKCSFKIQIFCPRRHRLTGCTTC